MGRTLQLLVWLLSISLLAGTSWADRLATDANGDVYTAGFPRRGGVEKRSGVDDSLIWQTVLQGSRGKGGDRAEALALDASNDLFVVGVLDNEATHDDFGVVKLSGTTGDVLWMRTLSGTDTVDLTIDAAYLVGVDGSGDAIVAGVLDNEGTSRDITVIRFEGATGNEVWRREFNGDAGSSDYPWDLVLDASGDVIVAGGLKNDDGIGIHQDFFLIRLRGPDGAELWRQLIDGTMAQEPFPADPNEPGTRDFDTARRVAIDASGDVIVGGIIYDLDVYAQFTLHKFEGTTGAEVWRQELNGTGYTPPDPNSASPGDGLHDIPHAIALDGSGDVIATGEFSNAVTFKDVAVVKLAGDDGSVIWQTSLDGNLSENDRAISVEVDETGDLEVVGVFSDFCEGGGKVVRLSGVDGSGSIPPDSCFQRGRRLVVRDVRDRPDRRLVALRIVETVRATPRGSRFDPTIHGATLKIFNPATEELASIDLPAPNWRADVRKKDYLYVDRGRVDGPCKRVIIDAPRRIVVRCVGDGIGFSLDEPSQGELAIALELGVDRMRYCAVFGGTILADESTATSTRRAGRAFFKAEDSPLAIGCPPF